MQMVAHRAAIGMDLETGSRTCVGDCACVKISDKKMATKGGHIDFMFLGPALLPGCWIRFCIYSY